MRAIFLFLLLAGAGIITWLVMDRPDKKVQTAKQEALSVSKHGQAFNGGIVAILEDYNQIAENFVIWDSIKAAAAAAELIQGFNQLPLDDLKKDSSAIYETALAFIENAKGDAQTIASEKSIRSQREAFHSLTDNFYQFLNTVKYDHQKLFLQECPMAFDDTKAGLWLSHKEQIRNPYLGMYHPTYGKGMLACGETKTELNNTGTKE